jgi:hypothetical protein
VQLGAPTLLSLGPPEAFIYAVQTGVSAPPLVVALTSPAEGDTFVEIETTDPGLLEAEGGGIMIPDGSAAAELSLVAKLAGGPVTLTATLGEVSRQAQVTVLAADRVPIPTVLQPDKNEVAPGEVVNFTLELDVPAPSAGQQVNLSPTGVAISLPRSVTVPAGERGTTFEVVAGDELGSAGIEATAGGVSVSAGITIRERPIVGVLIVEVLFDPTGTDDKREWLKIYNGGAAEVDLSGYSLGYGGADYSWGTYQLSGTVPAGECFVVGGPTSDESNHGPALGQALDFDPDLQNSGAKADGIALFDVMAAQITADKAPVDAVVYGDANESGLIGPDGAPFAAPHAIKAPSGQSLIRSGLTAWEHNERPNTRPCVTVP